MYKAFTFLLLGAGLATARPIDSATISDDESSSTGISANVRPIGSAPMSDGYSSSTGISANVRPIDSAKISDDDSKISDDDLSSNGSTANDRPIDSAETSDDDSKISDDDSSSTGSTANDRPIDSAETSDDDSKTSDDDSSSTGIDGSSSTGSTADDRPIDSAETSDDNSSSAGINGSSSTGSTANDRLIDSAETSDDDSKTSDDDSSSTSINGSSSTGSTADDRPIDSAETSDDNSSSAGIDGLSSTGSTADDRPIDSAETSDDNSSSAGIDNSSSTGIDNSSSTGIDNSSSTGIDDSSSTGITADAECTFTDADSAVSSKTSCSNIILKDITVPAGKTLDMTELNAGTTVTFEGTTTFEYEEWDGPLISFSGTDITITGAPGHVIDGNGALWWDGQGLNGGKRKPKFFAAHKLIDSIISNLNIQNYPVHCFSINRAQNLYIQDVTLDNSAGDQLGSDGEPLGHNTDGFGIGSSTGVYISGVTVKNQDDCLAINSGTDISFTGATCSGGNGISIGSVGTRDNNDVANVYIADSSVSDSQHGVRIKTIYDATGSVTNVTYSDISLNNITKYGIIIQQDYLNTVPTGTPTDGVPITDVTIRNIQGTVAARAAGVYILCASCSNWSWSGVAITGGENVAECQGVPSGVSC